jgi:hypothetical protein
MGAPVKDNVPITGKNSPVSRRELTAILYYLIMWNSFRHRWVGPHNHAMSKSVSKPVDSFTPQLVRVADAHKVGARLSLMICMLTHLPHRRSQAFEFAYLKVTEAKSKASFQRVRKHSSQMLAIHPPHANSVPSCVQPQSRTQMLPLPQQRMDSEICYLWKGCYKRRGIKSGTEWKDTSFPSIKHLRMILKELDQCRGPVKDVDFRYEV